MPENISPEERLLRLIRQDQRPQSADKKEEQEKEVLPARAQKARPKRPLSKIQVPFSLNLFSRFLLWIFLIITFYLLIDAFINSPGSIKRKVLTLKEAKVVDLQVVAQTKAQPKPITYYTEPLKSKSLFSAKGLSAKPTQPTPSFMEKVSLLRLQGIILGAQPQAIIEDTRSKKIHFLSPGERLGDIELKEVLPGKIKLKYQDQEMELAL